MKITLEQIKKLRQQTSAGVMDCRRALQEGQGDEEKAKAWLREQGFRKAAKRAEREASCGFIEAYTHAEGKIVSVVELLCETDFVARTEDFRRVAHEIALQIASMRPENQAELLNQPYIRDEKKSIGDLISELVSKTGEKIQIGRFARYEVGE